MTAKVAVVGAGLSGLAAARALADAGLSVTVFDKGRRPGGRANTREHGEHRFDHGAQFFTVRDDRTRPLLEAWLRRGVVAEWEGRLVRFSGATREPAKQATRFVGVPDMIAIALDMADGLEVRSGTRVAALSEGMGGWRLSDDAGVDLGEYSHVIVAVPAPQAVELLEPSPPLRDRAAAVTMSPCWAVMSLFAKRPRFDFDGAFLADGPASWIARDASKPARPDFEAWVIHATPGWTRERWDDPRESIGPRLRSDLEERLGPLPPVVFERAHRWGYALPSGDAPGVAYDELRRIGVCGDWCVGGRMEGALTSGMEVAAHVLGR